MCILSSVSPDRTLSAHHPSASPTTGVDNLDVSTSDVFGTDFITDLEAARRRSLEGSIGASSALSGYKRLEQHLPVLIRLLMVIMLLVLVFLAVLAALTANSIGGLVEAVRRREVDSAPPRESPLPPPSVITDADRFDRALQRLPDRRRDLLARRADLLLQEGEAEEAITLYARIMREEPAGLEAEELFTYAEALIAKRELARARRILGLLLGRVDSERDRYRAIDMLLKIDLATDS